MLETVGVRFPISPTDTQLKQWVWKPTIYPDGTRMERYTQEIALDSGGHVNFEFYPIYGKYKEPCLKTWLSLPKALFGENVSMIVRDGEMQEAIDMVNARLASLKWLPAVALRQGYLYRLDCAYNHQVGHRLPDYASALFMLEYPGRDTKPYHPHLGVQFYSKVATTTFYDKQAESLLPQAQGILRQESSLRKNMHIGRRLGVESPKLGDVRITMAEGILRKDLIVLGIDTSITVNRDQALDILMHEYGPIKGAQLYGVWYAIATTNAEQLRNLGANDRTMQRKVSQTRQAGLSLAYTDSQVPLPPLSIQIHATELSPMYQ
jgi:hypothetical protein